MKQEDKNDYIKKANRYRELRDKVKNHGLCNLSPKEREEFKKGIS